MRKGLFLFILLLSFFGIHSFAQNRDFSKATITIRKVAGSVYLLEGPGGNIAASVGDDGIVFVDDEFLPMAEKVETALKSISGKPVKFVFNTHWHPDHSSGNPYFGQKAVIIAHENVSKRMLARKRTGLPIVTFNNDVTLHLNGEEFQAIHFPESHTDGDTVVFFKQAHVVHMGDNLFIGMFPLIDPDSGGTLKGFIATAEKVLEQVPDDVKIIPGHGPVGTKDDLRKYVAMLKETSAIVQAGIHRHKTVDQLKEEKVLAKWDSLSHGTITTDVFLEMLYDALTANSTESQN
jgi:glyoxylase-like metal-dependent hydrolase (beta-lactamase superfamily II)